MKKLLAILIFALACFSCSGCGASGFPVLLDKPSYVAGIAITYDHLGRKGPNGLPLLNQCIPVETPDGPKVLIMIHAGEIAALKGDEYTQEDLRARVLEDVIRLVNECRPPAAEIAPDFQAL